MRYKRKLCRCRDCPLDSTQRVLGEAGFDKPGIVILGSYPTPYEASMKLPFQGAAGAKLKEAVNTAGLVWHTVYRTYAVQCPCSDPADFPIALSCCHDGLQEELEALAPRVILPLEQELLSSFGIDGKLRKVRGSVYRSGEFTIIPTYSPEFILKGMWKEEPTWIGDFAKAREISITAWKPPEERFNLFPTVKDVKAFVKDALENHLLLGVDIETTGFNEFYSKILMVGLASSPEDVLVIPFCKKGGGPYWNEKDQPVVEEQLKKLLKKGRLVFQNALFDTKHLEEKGFKIGSVEEDTMLLHHAIHPELPHNLGYIVSIYGKTPYWKDVVLGSEDRMISMDDKEVRTYNARDAAVLLQVLPEMWTHLKEVETEKTYREVSMGLVMPLLRMTQKGLKLDLARMASKKKLFAKQAQEAEKKLIKVCSLPEGFNLGSPDLMRLLLWGEKPKSYQKALEEKAAIDENPKRRKDTKKYAELAEKIRLVEGTTPLVKLPGLSQKRTDSGQLATDGEALVAFQSAAYRRLEAIEGLVRGAETRKEEKKRIEELLVFITEYGNYSKASKLESTFGGFPYGPDGRVHPSYKIHGTATGRLSSSDPNAQNIPSEVQDCFVAPTGYQILKADYSNIELRMLAYITGEEVLIDAFESGKNMHDLNTKLLFGIDESHPTWKFARRAAKVYVFGRSYGGGVEGIYKQIIVAVPDLGLTLAHFKQMDLAYFAKLKKYSAWVQKQQKKARETRCIETIFGRKRFLLGTPDEIERMALNTPIQGAAGEVALRAIIELDAALQKAYPYARLITTVHDSILVEVPTSQTNEVAKMMKKIMGKSYLIEGRKVCFPVDIEAGPSWGETKPITV